MCRKNECIITKDECIACEQEFNINNLTKFDGSYYCIACLEKIEVDSG